MLSPAQMAQLSRLLDTALELDQAGRRSWLEALGPEYQSLAPALWRALLPAGDDAKPSVALSRVGATIQSRSLGGGLRPDEMIGAYRLIRPLGAGGMAEVWLAERADGTFRREVALKLPMLFRLRQELAKRFERERDILAALVHPNIARLYDAGVSRDGLPYLAMEYVVGTPLTVYCDDHRLSIRARLEIFGQVLSAVRYAHANLVIHRDLKPSNILVTEAGQVQLLDFGIAKILTEGEGKETRLTLLGGRVLTPEYAAPEQIAGAPITTAADVYALGVLLYELLTGERPYRLERESLGALEEAILQIEPVPPSRLAVSEPSALIRATTSRELRKALAGDLDAITLRALKKAPTERYGSASEFTEDVGRFLRDEVVLAQSESATYRLGKFVRRHKAAIGGISALIIALAGGLATTTYEAHVAAAQRDVALQAQRRSLTQTAAARLREGDVAGALGIILGSQKRPYAPDALAVFQEARAADAQLLAFTGHTDWVMSAAISPDGRRIVTGSNDNSARVWDSVTGQVIRVLSGHANRVRSVTFSPDGRVIATASYDKTVRLWNAESGAEVRVLSGHTDRLRSVAYSPDGRRIVTASYDKTALIWDASNGQQRGILKGHTDVVTTAAFSPDGRQIVTASGDRTARVWDAVSGEQLRVLSGHEDFVNSAAFSADGLHIVTASDDGTSRIWDTASGKQLLVLRGHSNYVASAAYSPDGQRIVTASFDKSARVWDAVTGQQLMLLRGHTDRLESAVFSYDGRRIVTAALDKTARVWSAGSPLLSLRGHTDGLTTAQFSPDGHRILTASTDKTARIWDADNGEQLLTLSGHMDRVEAAAFSADGTRVGTAAWDGTARVWDSATGNQLLLLRGHTERLEGAQFSSDGRRLVTGARDATIRVWDTLSGEQLRVLSVDPVHVPNPEFSPDGRRILGAASDGTVHVWDADSGKQLLVLSGHTDFVTTAAYSPDGRRIVTASNDKTARIWDSENGKQLLVLSGHADRVETAWFSHDGRQVITASWDKTSRVWDGASGALLQILNGHTRPLEAAAFSPDGLRIVTASDDDTARVWDARHANLDSQMVWAEAAQFDPLTNAERVQLGLSAPAGIRRWPANASKCDQLAAAPYDPLRRSSGTMLDEIANEDASRACTPAKGSSDRSARLLYQHGRTLVASGDFAGAARDFEQALAAGYPVAAIDLARLLSQPSARMLNIARAISLREKAWSEGVAIAAFELGGLYENGVRRGPDTDTNLLDPDESLAWHWYQKGVEQGEPNSLARFAQNEARAALAAENASSRDAHLLQAFNYYAAASERARFEDWPDDAWRNWRYCRASMARMLAGEGMMEDVAVRYAAVRRKYTPRQSIWHRGLEFE